MSLESKLSSIGRLCRTLADIGPVRLQRRFRYELRQRIDRRLPLRISLAWARAHGHHPGWRTIHPSVLRDGVLAPPPEARSTLVVSFNFLNQERQLPWPIHWNNLQWTRLWQFHLHYFDWALEWLKEARSTGYWPDKSAVLQPLLDSWIASNSPGRGDGWHSYTLSLRTRNWIVLFRACPALATPKRLQSLWHQLCWLQTHPEHCHGGNHWLENLTALAVGGLHFDGPKATRMHHRAMCLLKRELQHQVLEDGGHEERSASYHLLMLHRLSELHYNLDATACDIPPWLIEAIQKMARWAELIRLETGEFPRFNDSAADASPPLDEVLASVSNLFPQRSPPFHFPLPQIGVTDLPNTGWAFLRPGHGWELIFKCGIPCPNHLPSHAHSDQLSFDLCHKGSWLFSEAGTSIYGNGLERFYERSGAAHNVLQLGVQTAPGVICWIEPVDVWGGFRAGRKAQPRDRSCGQTDQGIFFAEGSHNGFDYIRVNHFRRVSLSGSQPSQITLHVHDTVIARSCLYVRQWWHLGPEMNCEFLDQLALDAPTLLDFEAKWQNTWFSTAFGKRLPRQSLCISGRLPVGKHKLISSVHVLHQHISN